MPVRDFLNYLTPHQERWNDLLRELVEHESGTYDKADVDALARVLRDHLTRLDFATELLPQAQYGDHVVGRRQGSSGRRMLLVGHFDTVFGHGALAERPFRIEAGRATGPGVYDMKGGLVVLLAALGALRETRSPAFERCGLTVFLNSDEEVLSPTSKDPIDAEARRGQAVCVLEPARPGGEYVFIRKGAGKIFLRVAGRAAHAGVQPERGISANLELAHKVVRLHALTDLAAGTTVNVGVMRGGERSNIICPEAYAEIDLRASTPEAAEAAIAAIRRIAEASTVPGATGELWGGLDFPPLPRRPENEALFALLREVAREVGFEAGETSTGGGSDANHAGQLAPVLDGMGVCGDGAHTEREEAVLASIPQRAAALAGFVERWVGGVR